MKYILLSLLFIQLHVLSVAQVKNGSETNKLNAICPIFRGDYPDPSILRDGDTYYIVHSSFNYFPGLLIWKSNDLRNWTPVTHA